MRVNHLLASTALSTSALFASGAAFAQPMTYSWTGWYVGLNAGGASSHIEHSVILPGLLTASSSGRAGGFTGGGQAGYNWLIAPRWLAGVEADINYLHGARTSTFGGIFGPGTDEDVVGRQTSKVRWLSTVRARFGHTWDRSFLYATGGLAIGGVSSSVSATVTDTGGGGDTSIFAGSRSSTRAGWAVGAGYEHAFTDRLSAKLEYLHFDLGSIGYNVNLVSSTGGGSAGIPLQWLASANFSGDIVRVGVNYKVSP